MADLVNYWGQIEFPPERSTTHNQCRGDNSSDVCTVLPHYGDHAPRSTWWPGGGRLCFPFRSSDYPHQPQQQSLSDGHLMDIWDDFCCSLFSDENVFFANLTTLQLRGFISSSRPVDRPSWLVSYHVMVLLFPKRDSVTWEQIEMWWDVLRGMAWDRISGHYREARNHCLPVQSRVQCLAEIIGAGLLKQHDLYNICSQIP